MGERAGGLRAWWTAVADLALGAQCPVCGTAALALCPPCRAALAPDPRPVDLDLPWPVVAARDYDERATRVLSAWKERGWTSCTPDLGRLLACAVATLVPADDKVELVPVPTSRRNRRRRGRDHAVELARSAAQALGSVGLAADVAPRLGLLRQPVDQAGLGAADRRVNVEGVFGVRGRSRGRFGPDVATVLVDDVVTTGATAGAACVALAEAGLDVRGAAVVAARRWRA